ncbi:hypothetical protein HYU22_00570 [Candidatus Woesearchaeota archaeon]|nr:hypothetical protein [Candidatus Woesearchaeota archaeon]
MVKTILFLTGSCDREIWMWKIYQEMAKTQAIKPHFIATREKNLDYLVAQGVPKNEITTLFPFHNGSTADRGYLSKCEQRYNINIWDAWSVSAVRKRSRGKLSTEEILSYFQSAFEGMERIVEEIKPDYCICYGPSGYHAIVLYSVLQKNKVRIIELVSSIVPNRFTFAEDLSNIWPSLDYAYKDIKRNGLSSEERIKSEQFVKDFQNKPKIQDCAKEFKEPLRKKAERASSYAYQVLKYRKLPPDLRFVFWPLIQKVYDHAGIFETPRPGEKYVLFPLHYQPESTTLIYGKWYVDQLSLIENISKSMPLTHLLYVKEHPFGYGNRNLSFYKRIKKIPNVRLISPHQNNFELIKKSSLLLTITGTSGWEALLFEIPAVTFGNIFYNVCEETIKVKNIEFLPEIIKNSVDRKINRDNLINFVAAMFRCSYSGLARLPSDCNNHSLDKDNIKRLVQGISDYMLKKEKN